MPPHLFRRVRAGAATLAALALLATVPGSVPTLPDRPIVPAGLAAGTPSWSGEPSAASLAEYGARPRTAEQFYFVLPDRFANGSTANDRGGLTGDRLATGLDPADKGFYHGGDIQGVIDRLDYIQGLGTTAIWLAPVFKNNPVQGTGADASAGYHGYWINDFTQVDPHFGTNVDLERLVKLAHRRGLKVYLDVIVNHTADVIKYAENQYSYRDTTDYPYEDANGRPFDDRNYAAGTRGFPKVTADSFPYTPVLATPADAKAKRPAWLNDPTMYHNRGDSTFSGENSENGDFFGLDDLWTERPEVVRGMTDIYADWVTGTGVDGFRIDTVKHVNLDFWPQFTAGVQRKAGKDFFMFGEVYSADPEVDSTYVRRGGLPATLDFPFQETAVNYAVRGGSAAALAKLYEADDLYAARGTDARSLPTFLGNHDMGRIGSFVATSGTPADEHLRRDAFAHELMFLTRGQPVVYSGDEQGFTGPGGDKDARQDMFASKVPDYLDDDLLGTDRTHATDQYDRNHPLYRTIADLSALRRDHPALRDGVQVTRTAADGAGVFAFSRTDPDRRVEYVVAVNNAATPQPVAIPTYSANATFDRVYASAGGSARPAATAATDGAGALNVTVPPLSAVVYKARKALPKPSAAPAIRITTPPAGAAVPTRAEVTAEVTGDPLASVSFAARVGDGPWRLLGTADRAPYRVYHDLAGLPAGTKLEYKAVVEDGNGRTASAKSAAKVGTPPIGVSADNVIVHYQRPSGGYDPWGVYAWGDVAEPTTWPAGQPFAGEDSYGRFAWVKLKPGAKSVGFVVVDSNGVKDVEADRTVDPARTPEIWLKQGDPAVYPTRAAATGQPDPPVDRTTAVLHYRRPAGDYAGWGLHVWTGAAGPTDWNAPIQPTFDAYGAVFRVPLAPGATTLNYIIHNGDTKDLPSDQTLDLTGVGPEAWLLAGQQRYLRPMPTQAAPDTDLTKARAEWIDRSTIAWRAGPTDGRRYELVSDPAGKLSVVDGQLAGGQVIALRATGGLTEGQRARFPHLWQYQTFTIDRADLAKVPAALRGQLVATERDVDGKLLAATSVQIPGVLDDIYPGALDARLGPTFDGGRPTLAVWAPTAQSVSLELSPTPAAAPQSVAMRRDDATGVWRVTGDRSWTGRYYRFKVTAWQPAARAVVTASVTDPYSVSLAADSTHSQIVDLNDAALAPDGWKTLRKPAPAGKPQIQELSVRDFSVGDASVPAAERGTYLAFTRPSSTGMTHLKSLAEAGASHVHLLPVFDLASVPERRADQVAPACDLPALPADSEQQQACVAAVADRDGYNWGYDPFHYSAPEGSYATDPAGTPRIKQFRQMVAGLNNTGLRVVVDVVYNHTPAAGTDRFSVLDQIVPGYYQRLLDDGSVATSTCCANTAPENAMMGKLVIDSVVLWAKQYKVDGFRFDLMGHHPKANILAIRAALDALTVAKDGVDGKKIIVYGEGWNFGEIADDVRFTQATQKNMAGTGIGTFNDRLRDAVRGGGPFDANPRVQGFGSGLFTDPNGDPVNGTAAEQRTRLLHYHDLIQVGLSGNLAGYRFTSSGGETVTGSQVDYNGSPAGYTAGPGEAVTYVDAHDNEILYDAFAYKLPAGTPPGDRARMQVVALSTTVFGQGAGFITAGSDRLRSKSLDRNSYNSGDWFNQIRWDCAEGNGFGAGLPPAVDNRDKWPYAGPLLADPSLVPDCAMINSSALRYAELLAVRGSTPVFGLATADEVQRRLAFPLAGPKATPGVITMTLDARGLDNRWTSVTVVFNATPDAVRQTVPALAGASVALHPVLAGSVDPVVRSSGFDRSTGTFTVPARTVAVYMQS